MRRLQQRGDRPDEDRRRPTCQFYDNKKHRQHVDEPQSTERLDEGFEVHEPDMAPTRLAGEAGRLEAELNAHPEHVEICKMHDLAIDISAPVAVDDEGQE